MAPGEDIDSGMESLTTNSKDQTPIKSDEDELLDDDDLDESLAERLWGLSEMFPESVRNATYSVASNTWHGVKERAQMDEIQRSQQKQVLLGPSSAVSGSAVSGGAPQR